MTIAPKLLSDHQKDELRRAYIANENMLAVSKRLDIRNGSIYYWIKKLCPDIWAVRHPNGHRQHHQTIREDVEEPAPYKAPTYKPPVTVLPDSSIRPIPLSRLMAGR